MMHHYFKSILCALLICALLSAAIACAPEADYIILESETTQTASSAETAATDTATGESETPVLPTDTPAGPTDTPVETTETPVESTPLPSQPRVTPDQPSRPPIRTSEIPTEETETPTEPSVDPTETQGPPTEPTFTPTEPTPTVNPTEPTPTEPTETTSVEQPTQTPQHVAVSGIEFSAQSLTLVFGERVPLSVHVLPENATNRGLTVTVSDESVISYENGYVEALSEGTAVITAVADEDGYIARCRVTVEQAPFTEPTVTPTETTVPPTETTVPPTETTVPPTEPTVTPTEPTVTPTEPTVTPTEPTVTPTEPTVTPTEPTVTPTEPLSYTAFYPEEKVIAFTFDDGPDWWTPYILDTLQGDDKVSFFITGYMIDENPSYAEFVRRALDMGCEVGLHAYYHEHNVYFQSEQRDNTEENFKREVLDLDAKYRELFGRAPLLYRPQGGGYNPQRNYGYMLALWSLDSLDWETYTNYVHEYHGQFTGLGEQYNYLREAAANEIADRILSQIKPGDIVLMHDVYNISRMAFAIVYPKLKEMGYRLVTVTELLGVNAEEHIGQYFFSTYHYGYMGNDVDLSRTSRARIELAPPPGKEND